MADTKLLCAAKCPAGSAATGDELEGHERLPRVAALSLNSSLAATALADSSRHEIGRLMRPASVDTEVSLPSENGMVTESTPTMTTSNLYTQLKPYVARVVRPLLGEVPSPEFVHDICTEAILSLSRFRGECAFSSWVYAVAVRHAKKWLRTERRRRGLLQAVAKGIVLTDVRRPDELLSVLQLGEWLHSALEALPERQRDCFLLVHIEDQAAASVASQLGISAAAVRLNVHRARRRLRRRLSSQTK